MADRMRVLLLAIFPRVEQRVKALIGSISFVDLLDRSINDAESAIEVLVQEKPDVVLLANDFPGMDGYYLASLIRKESPFTQVIVLSEVSSAESVRLAMRAGACDFLSYKTASVEELSAALEHAGDLNREERAKRKTFTQFEEEKLAKRTAKAEHRKYRSRIITFYSPKGGSGVSTLLANIAQVLHDKGRKVVVIDGSLQYGDIAVLYNQFSQRTIANVANKIDELDEDLLETVLVKAGADILPAPNKPAEAVQISGQSFSRILKFVSAMDYDIMLVNTSPYINDPVFTAIESSELLVLVTMQDISSIRASRSFINLVEELDMDRSKLEIVINQFDDASTLTPDRIGESLGAKITLTIPVDRETAVRSGNLGIPFVIDYKDLPISKAILALADRIEKRLEAIDPVPLEEKESA